MYVSPRFYVSLAALIVMTLLSGCSGMVITGSADVEKAAFGPKKHYAVVSIASMKTFGGERGMGQMFKSADEIAGANTQPLLNALTPQIFASLKKDHNFSLLAEKAVLGSKAYRNIKEDERITKVLFFSDSMNVAPHYKYFSDPQKLCAIGNESGCRWSNRRDNSFLCYREWWWCERHGIKSR